MAFLKSYFNPAAAGQAGRDVSSTNPAPPPTPSRPRNARFTSSSPMISEPTEMTDLPESSSASGSHSRPSSAAAGLQVPKMGPNRTDGPLRTTSAADLGELKAQVMCSWLHQQQESKMWSNGGLGEGVLLKRAKNEYICCPEDLASERGGLFDAVLKHNVRCALTMNTRVVKLFLRGRDVEFVPLDDGLRLQILPTISDLPQSKKHHFAAFIRDSSTLVVWDDDPNEILGRAQNIEDRLMKTIWKQSDEEEDEKLAVNPRSKTGSRAPSVYRPDVGGDSDQEKLIEPPRRIVLVQPMIAAATLVLVIIAIGGSLRQVAVEIAIDNGYIRLALLAVAPFQIWLALFFMQSLVTGVAQIIGPVNQMNENTKYFSGIFPPRLQTAILPHVTIQCPVYKEGLWTVIDPTVKSIKAAISIYEMQGGTANIFINDDGMQVISPEDAQERRDYYDEHSIGWVSRPGHNSKPDGDKVFLRAGKFKKASNMNYALDFSTRTENALASIERSETWTVDDEREAYIMAFSQTLEQDAGWTQAGGNVRVGDYILLIDSDTRVPTDCLLDAVSEMEASPEVAIIQFASGVMNVTESWFEKGITFFTNFVYTSITHAVSSGDVAPFVGHNAFLRWSAIQDVAFIGDDGVTEKFWSENTVSEDFDIALRLQTNGYVLRLATYADRGFKEGVSLTVYDELARWEKYAYGCGELVFHPLTQWLRRGPFTPLFRQFIGSNMPLHSKFTIMAYIGTYYAIASTWILVLVNYCLDGWFIGHLDHYYVDSFRIYFSLILVFAALGNVALGVLRYRVEDRSLFGSLAENFKWLLLLSIFLGGLSIHISQALLSHLLGINMSWGATSKEATDTTFFQEIPTIARKFRGTFLWCILMVTMMIVVGGVGPVGALVPYNWQIKQFTAIWPLTIIVASHFLLPLVLNPGLMQFTF